MVHLGVEEGCLTGGRPIANRPQVANQPRKTSSRREQTAQRQLEAAAVWGRLFNLRRIVNPPAAMFGNGAGPEKPPERRLQAGLPAPLWLGI
jgi:hypothetical protein